MCVDNVRYSNQYIKAVQTFLDDEFLPQHPEPFAPHSLSFQDLQWAWYAVRTRSWTGLQVPFADMFNHHPEGVRIAARLCALRNEPVC